MIVTSQYGVGVSPDSVNYVEIANNFKDGKGIINNKGKLVNHWPPFYSILKGTFSKLTGVEVLNMARYLNAVLIALVFVLFNLIIKRYQLNTALQASLNLILLFSAPLTIFLMVWSEGLFMFILLTIVYFYLNWLDTNKTHQLILAGLLSGIMILTRYAGIGFILGILIYTFFLHKDKFSKRFLYCCIYGGISLATFSTWTLYTSLSEQATVSRKFVYHPITLDKIKTFFITLNNWIVPSYSIIAYIFLAILFMLLWSNLKAKQGLPSINTKAKESMKLIGILIAAYFFLLLVAISFFDAYTPLDNRILSSIFVLILLLLAPLLNKISFHQIEQRSVFAILGVILISTSLHNIPTYQKYYQEGRGYNSKKWIESETIQALKELKFKKVYSNGPELLRFYFPEKSKNLLALPRWISPFTRKKASEFDKNFNNIKRKVDKGKAIVIHLDHIKRYYLPDKRLLLHKLKEHEISHFNDGAIIQKK